MSLEHVNTGYFDFKQVIPNGLDDLSRVYAEESHTGRDIGNIGRSIYGFEGGDRHSPTTTDGYKWHWGLLFNMENGQAAFLFPLGKGYGQEGGAELDRHVGVHVKGDMGKDELDKIIERLTAKFTAYNEFKRA
ncbi:MAG: hypothetical protein KJ709_04760 [Nanoarchaeota archaeon]|nr:hypothetical protein [Nanoarchaeota archaeon]